MIVGEVVRLNHGNYVVVNKTGTLEKLPEINLLGRLYFEILQGLGKYKSVCEVREICNKYLKLK